MKVRIYQPTRNAMQSGNAKTHHWKIDFLSSSAPFIDPLMGWSGMTDMAQEVELTFATKDEAIAYAKAKGFEYEVVAPEAKKMIPKSYAANFAYNRVLED